MSKIRPTDVETILSCTVSAHKAFRRSVSSPAPDSSGFSLNLKKYTFIYETFVAYKSESTDGF